MKTSLVVALLLLFGCQGSDPHARKYGGVITPGGVGTVTQSASGTTNDLTIFTSAGAIGNYTGATPCSAGAYFSGLSPTGSSTCTAAGAVDNGTTTTIGGQLTVNDGTGAAVVPGLLQANGDVTYVVNASPTAPGAGARVATQLEAGRAMLGAQPSLGPLYQFQPQFGRRKISRITPQSSTTTTNDGITITTIGTATQRAPASTSLFTSLSRVGYLTATSAASAAGADDQTSNLFWRGNAAGLGGFFLIYRFGISDAVLVTTANMFVGLRVAAALADALPSTFTNAIGVGVNTSDTVLQLYASGSAAQARAAIVIGSGPNAGGNFPANTVSTDVYELILFAPSNSASVMWQLNRLNTGDSATGTISVAANLPSSTTFLSPVFLRSNGTAGATAAGIDIFGFYGEDGQ